MSERDARGRRRVIPVWALPLLIGVVTITAGVVTWRAGQLGSSAAFEDRQSVGQTIVQQQQSTEVGLEAINDAVAYVRYVADYAEAAVFDGLAPTLSQQGEDPLARNFTQQADQLRESASELAVASGVFGEQTVLTQLVASPDEPLSFDLDEQIDRLQTEVTRGIDSPGVPNPDEWADRADETRSRVRGLRLATTLLLGAALLLTVAQLTDGALTRRIFAGLGSTVYVTVLLAAVITVF